MRTSGFIGFALFLVSAVSQLAQGRITEVQDSALQKLAPWLANYRSYPSPETLPNAPENCRLIHLDFIGRHGSRYPKENELALIPKLVSHIEELIENRCLSKKGQRVIEQARILYTWSKAHHKNFSDITPRGWQELYGLGHRSAYFLTTATRYPPKTLTISLNSSETTRTIHSQQAFWEGLSHALPTPLNVISHLDVIDNPKWVLRNYKQCTPAFSSFSSKSQKADFLDKVAGIKNNLPEATLTFAKEILTDCPDELAPDLLENIYRLCLLDAPRAYPQGLCEIPREWVDRPGGIEVLEWLQSIHSWRKFYDFALSEALQEKGANLASPLLRDMLEQTEKGTTQEPTSVSAYYRFSHDSMLAKLMTLMEILPSQGNDHERFAVWQPSFHTPMAANLQFHLYQCPE